MVPLRDEPGHDRRKPRPAAWAPPGNTARTHGARSALALFVLILLALPCDARPSPRAALPPAAPRPEPVLQFGHARTVAAIALQGSRLVSVDVGGSARIWDMGVGLIWRYLDPPPAPVRQVTMSPAGTMVALATTDGSVAIVDVITTRVVRRLPPATGETQALLFSPDGSTLAVAGGESGARRIDLWDVASGHIQSTMEGRGEVRGLAFSPQATTLAVALRPEGRQSDLVEIWDAHAGTRVSVLRADRTSAESVCFSPDGTLVAAGTLDHTVDVWDAATTTWLGAIRSGTPQDPRTEGAVRQVVFTPDGGSLLVTTGLESGAALAQRWAVSRKAEEDGSPRLFATPLPAFDARGLPLRCVAVDPSGRVVAGGTEDGTVLVWDAQSGAVARVLDRDSRLQPWAAFLADGTLAVAGHEVRTAAEGATWDSGSRRLRALGAPSDAVMRMTLAPGGQHLAGATEHSIVTLWNAGDGTLLATLGGHTAPVRSLAFSPDGRMLATGGADCHVNLWDVASRGLLQRLVGHGAEVTAVTFSPDGHLLASAGADQSVRVWNPHDVSLVGKVDAPGAVGALAFSTDGTLLACGVGSQVCVWNLGSGQVVSVAEGLAGGVSALAFSPDPARLAVGVADGTVRLVHLGTRASTAWHAHSGAVSSLAFSRDGRLLASCGADRTVRAFRIPGGAVLFTLCMAASQGRRAWLALDSEARVDGEGEVARLLAWRLGPRIVPFAASPSRQIDVRRMLGAP